MGLEKLIRIESVSELLLQLIPSTFKMLDKAGEILKSEPSAAILEQLIFLLNVKRTSLLLQEEIDVVII